MNKNEIHIGFEASSIISYQKTGIGYVAENILCEMSKMKNVKCILQYFPKGIEIDYEKLQQYKDLGILNDVNNNISYKSYKLWGTLLKIPYNHFFKETKITIFPNFIIPIGVRGKTIVIVHDMVHKAYPQTVKWSNKIWVKYMLFETCKRADAIIAVSEFTKNEILKYINVPENKIHVIYNGINIKDFTCKIDKKEIEEKKKKYNIDGEFLLYLGTIEPRKNIVNIIRAYKEYIEQLKNKKAIKLVLVGKKGWMYDEVFDLIKEEKTIKYVGYIENRDKIVLLHAAKIFIFPSLYEGFGLPILEAMACRTPVITSKTSALKEIAGDAALLVNPLDCNEICKAIQKIDSNRSLQDKLVYKGYERAKLFSWEKSAREYLNIINNLL